MERFGLIIVVRMAVAGYDEGDEIYCQTNGTNNEQHFGLFQLFLMKEALDGFNENAEAEREEKDGVDQSAYGLCS